MSSVKSPTKRLHSDLEEVFDNKISNEVSVSRILDYFLQTNDSANMIVDYLNGYKDMISEIFTYSDCYPKMFQSDFFRELDALHVERFFPLLKYTALSVKHTFLSQILQLKDEFDPLIVKQCEVMMSNLTTNTNIRHKYAGYNGRYGKMLDSIFSTGHDACYIAEHMPPEAFSKLCSFLHSSLYEGRILQMDFYSSLSPLNRQILLKNVKSSTLLLALRFVKQFLTSPDVTVNEKYELFRAVKNGNFWSLPKHYADDGMMNTITELMDCQTYAEFAIRTTLMGADMNRDIIFHLLFKSDLRILFEMLEDDRDKLDKICKISELLQCLKDSVYNRKNPLPKLK